MTKLRFPSLGGGGHKDGEQATAASSARNNDQRHISPFRSSRNSKDSGGGGLKGKASLTTTSATAPSEGPQRSKTPGKVRWLVNASSDLVKSATTLKRRYTSSSYPMIATTCPKIEVSNLCLWTMKILRIFPPRRLPTFQHSAVHPNPAAMPVIPRRLFR